MSARELNRLFDQCIEHVERDDAELDSYDIDKLLAWDAGTDVLVSVYADERASASWATRALHAWWLVVARPAAMVRIGRDHRRLRRGGELDV